MEHHFVKSWVEQWPTVKSTTLSLATIRADSKDPKQESGVEREKMNNELPGYVITTHTTLNRQSSKCLKHPIKLWHKGRETLRWNPKSLTKTLDKQDQTLGVPDKWFDEIHHFIHAVFWHVDLISFTQSISLCYPLYEYGHQEHCCFISIYMHIALHGVLCISMGIRNTVVLLVCTARCTLHKYGHQDVLVSRARLSRGESESLACETKNVGICMMKYFRYLWSSTARCTACLYM